MYKKNASTKVNLVKAERSMAKKIIYSREQETDRQTNRQGWEETEKELKSDRIFETVIIFG